MQSPRSAPKNKVNRLPRTSYVKIKGDNYTIPLVRYQYQQVSWEKFMSSTYDGYTSIRSSFIPYFVYDDVKYWILGSFHDYPKDILMDFGGKCSIRGPGGENYQHQFGCAMLELNEESRGLLVLPVLKSLGMITPTIYQGKDERNKEAVWFVMVQLNYEDVYNIREDFLYSPNIPKGERLGPIDFYPEQSILGPSFPHRTSRNLTDFVDYLKRKN